MASDHVIVANPKMVQFKWNKQMGHLRFVLRELFLSQHFWAVCCPSCIDNKTFLAPSTMYGGAVSTNNQYYYQGWDPKLYCRQRPQGKHHKNILTLKI